MRCKTCHGQGGRDIPLYTVTEAGGDELAGYHWIECPDCSGYGRKPSRIGRILGNMALCAGMAGSSWGLGLSLAYGDVWAAIIWLTALAGCLLALTVRMLRWALGE